MLENTFGAINFESFENFTGKNLQMADFNRNKSISTEETSKGWMFFVINDTKSFMKPECFVTPSFAMTHPYKWPIADCYLEKYV